MQFRIKGASSLEEAISEQNDSPYGNGTSIFTQSGRVSEDAVRELEAGMIGVNIGIPVPREPFSLEELKILNLDMEIYRKTIS